MIKSLQILPPLILLVIATALEVSGDALVRMAIFKYTGVHRVACFAGGTALLLGYGSFLNFAPLEFGQVVGLYIATLFVMWQIINYAFFGTAPTLPVLVGGIFVVTGGAIITFWQPAS